jgi:hypothetical protein
MKGKEGLLAFLETGRKQYEDDGNDEAESAYDYAICNSHCACLSVNALARFFMKIDFLTSRNITSNYVTKWQTL